MLTLYHGANEILEPFERDAPRLMHLAADPGIALTRLETLCKTGVVGKFTYAPDHPLELPDLGSWAPVQLAGELEARGLLAVGSRRAIAAAWLASIEDEEWQLQLVGDLAALLDENVGEGEHPLSGLAQVRDLDQPDSGLDAETADDLHARAMAVSDEILLDAMDRIADSTLLTQRVFVPGNNLDNMPGSFLAREMAAAALADRLDAAGIDAIAYENIEEGPGTSYVIPNPHKKLTLVAWHEDPETLPDNSTPAPTP